MHTTRKSNAQISWCDIRLGSLLGILEVSTLVVIWLMWACSKKTLLVGWEFQLLTTAQVSGYSYSSKCTQLPFWHFCVACPCHQTHVCIYGLGVCWPDQCVQGYKLWWLPWLQWPLRSVHRAITTCNWHVLYSNMKQVLGPYYGFIRHNNVVPCPCHYWNRVAL